MKDEVIQLTIKQALGLGYEQCMPKYGAGEEDISLISDIDSENNIELLSDDDNPMMLLSTIPDAEKSEEYGSDWYPITNIRLIP